ncbi:MAG TPA: IS630 transposase-related protein [Blastocatellia bacterium]|nr:IS630 transposase-related protein [Blastocatellia bacterium]
MRAYSLDLRQKVVQAYERGDGTIDEIASLFSVGPTFVKKMLRLHRQGDDLSPLPHSGGHTPKLSDKRLQMIRAEIARNNDVTSEELRELLRKRASVEVSQPTISRALARLNLPRKKNSRGKRAQ